MTTRRDAALALLALSSFVAIALLVEASLSPPSVVLGGVGTVVFELLAARNHTLVRRCWERWPVQFAALAIAIGGAAIGARLAPSPALSALCGATVTYLGLVALVWTGRLPPPEEWRR